MLNALSAERNNCRLSFSVSIMVLLSTMASKPSRQNTTNFSSVAPGSQMEYSECFDDFMSQTGSLLLHDSKKNHKMIMLIMYLYLL